MVKECRPPRPPRTPMVARLEIFHRGTRIGAVLTCNVSERGIGGRGYVPLRVNQPVTIALDGSERLSARVAWRKAGDFGLELANPIELSHYDLATTLSGDSRHL